MTDYVLLPSPSANRVYAATAPQLAAAELTVCAPWADDVQVVDISGLTALGFSVDTLTDDHVATLTRQSTFQALFERVDDDLLRPARTASSLVLDEDLVTIPRYQGKTNEQFTALLMNVTLSQVTTTPKQRRCVLDPMCGRGTTLTTAWLRGVDAAGVEADGKAVESMGAFLRTWLRRKRLKHHCEMNPVRREGKSLGKRFDARVTVDDGPLTLSVFTGDTTQSKALWGKRQFDAIVTDAPYGVVHANHTGRSSKERSPRALLSRAIPVWAQQLKPGGALGMSWNTYGLTREELCEMLSAAGLTPAEGPVWLCFAHRVDSSINRDLVVATR